MGDYIEREAAIEYLTLNMGWQDEDGYPVDDWDERKAHIADLINGIHATDVRPVKRGKWIDRDDDYYGWNMWACSACGEEFVLTEGTPDMNDYHFCPNCGADMREAR